MGRRKIEIKAIKDDRNRSVTFLKRKGGLFKKAHELSVLCSVDVAVFVFGNNKKLYEYSSSDMRDLISRYQFHGGPNEHKGPGDFNGGAGEDDDDDDPEPSPPLGHDGLEAQMMPPQYHGQQPPQFHQIRHHTPSASPPIPNGAFPGHQHHPRRSHTPQPVGSRPGSRNDVHRMGPGPAPPGGGHHGVPYMPTPPIYNPPHGQPSMVSQHGPQYQYPPQQQQQHPPQQQPPAQPQAYMEDRRVSAPPTYSQPPQPMPTVSRTEPSPPQPPHTHAQPIPQISTTPPQHERRDPQPPPPVVPKMEQQERPQPHLGLNTDMAIKKLPSRKTHSIFTPIEENRSILSQHLASFASEPQALKGESSLAVAAANANRPHSVDITSSARTISPPQDKARTASTSSIPETTFTPPSRSNSFKTGAAAAASARPRLKVQIPDGSEPGGATGGDSVSPRPADPVSQPPHRHGSHSSVVLPPPSPSASALLSAGASGPPNPFARPPPQSNNAETPASALPSRFLGNEFLASPSSFYNDWNFRAAGDNTLPSPLPFATPIAGSGPSFLREESNYNHNTSAAAGITSGANNSTAGVPKRKSPELGDHDHSDEAKRVRVE